MSIMCGDESWAKKPYGDRSEKEDSAHETKQHEEEEEEQEREEASRTGTIAVMNKFRIIVYDTRQASQAYGGCSSSWWGWEVGRDL